MPVPESRIRALNDRPVRADGAYVLHWMCGVRRRPRNWALQRAVEHARALRLPLLVVSDLRLASPRASVRRHKFVLEGLLCGVRTRRPAGVRFLPLVETRTGAAAAAIKALADRAAAVVVDDVPWSDAAPIADELARRVRVRVEAVDAWGLLPMSAAPVVYPTAFAFRCFLQKALLPHLVDLPEADPLRGLRLPPCPELPVPPGIHDPSVAALERLLEPGALAALGVAEDPGPGTAAGGSRAALARWRAFRDGDLSRYGDGRNHPDDDAASGLSPYLHHGMVGVAGIWADLVRTTGWEPDRIGKKIGGKKEGWWGLDPSLESFLDELVTWRELGANFCSRRADFAAYESLPAWARQTLDRHASDPRPHRYELEELRGAATHDELWNAAQRQLVSEGRLHNYLRMLWGKKILEWSAQPREALAACIELNDRYALDGEDPNSYSGILWTLGRYDRPWAPERPIFGTIRYMSSDNTRRKLRVRAYLERYGPRRGAGPLFEAGT